MNKRIVVKMRNYLGEPIISDLTDEEVIEYTENTLYYSSAVFTLASKDFGRQLFNELVEPLVRRW